MSTTAPARFLPAGVYPASQIPVGAHVLYGTRDVGRITRIEPMTAVLPGMVDAVRTGFTKDIVGLPLVKFEVTCSGGRIYYFARLSHEPVAIVEV